MITIRWLITDTIKDVSLFEFASEWNGIYGYFEISINNHVIGFCPNRELMNGEEGNEDILYWLYKLSEGIIELRNGREHEIQLLSMNLAKIVLHGNSRLKFSLVYSNTQEVIWFEEITIQEWYDAVLLAAEEFIMEIKKINAALLNADLIKNLSDVLKHPTLIGRTEQEKR